MTASAPSARRGAPLLMLGVVLCLWVAARAALWENPAMIRALDESGLSVPLAKGPFAQKDRASSAVTNGLAGVWEEGQRAAMHGEPARRPGKVELVGQALGLGPVMPSGPPVGNSDLDRERLEPAGRSYSGLNEGEGERDRRIARRAGPGGGPRPGDPSFPGSNPPPFAAPDPGKPNAEPDRWSLDAWVFAREGSRSAPIAQTRVPIYGASQAGAILQFRADPDASRDPRVFVRAYQALVPNGESELALGVSARPVQAMPVRAVVELRGVEDSVGSDLRPAAYAVTEIAPITLSAGFDLEAYGGAGYVGGRAETFFADGQIGLFREVATLDGVGNRPVRLSIGGGAWGGAQTGAERLDIGPSVRIDMTLGEKPVRLSVDYRGRAAGDAAPGSGVAATLSTRF